MEEQMQQDRIWVCPNCTMGSHLAGQCPNCKVERVECRAGSLHDPSRRPLISADGRVETHAPLWWLQNRLGNLAAAAEELRRR